jgi:hypothetical protein
MLCAASVFSLMLVGQAKPAKLSVYWCSVLAQQLALQINDFAYSLWLHVFTKTQCSALDALQALIAGVSYSGS